MKLFRVDYTDDYDDDTYLVIGSSLEEVEDRERTKLRNLLPCYMGCSIYQIDEIDGYKIELIKNDEKPKDCSNCANYTEYDEVDNVCYMCEKDLENNFVPIDEIIEYYKFE